MIAFGAPQIAEFFRRLTTWRLFAPLSLMDLEQTLEATNKILSLQTGKLEFHPIHVLSQRANPDCNQGSSCVRFVHIP